MKSFRQQLEEYNNPEEIRQNLALGKYTSSRTKIVKEYLDSVDRKLEQERMERAEVREEEALQISRLADKIAREALRVSKHDRNIAIISAIAAVIAALAAIITIFVK